MYEYLYLIIIIVIIFASNYAVMKLGSQFYKDKQQIRRQQQPLKVPIVIWPCPP